MPNTLTVLIPNINAAANPKKRVTRTVETLLNLSVLFMTDADTASRITRAKDPNPKYTVKGKTRDRAQSNCCFVKPENTVSLVRYLQMMLLLNQVKSEKCRKIGIKWMTLIAKVKRSPDETHT